jgi:cytochrome c-type biogenesis protein CcmH
MKTLLILLLCLVSFNSFAREASDLAADPAIEKRMVALTQNLRCLVCQNESLAASQAELALDLRKEVREMMKQGKSDKEITDYLVARYGDFVLYKPPVQRNTILLWFGPFAMLLLGAAVLAYQVRKRRRLVQESELTPEAQQRVALLLNEEDNK